MTTAAKQGLSEVTKTAALLAAMVLHNLAYPLSATGGVWPVVFYAFYASMFVLATWLLSQSTPWRRAALASGVAVFIAGMVNSYAPSAQTVLAVYLTSIAYHVVIIVVLARYTFASRQVLTEVLLAATSLYLVLGSVFAAIYGVILWLDPASFAAPGGGAVQWQQLLYYSYVTLTTLGYGDILPMSYYAQAFAAFQAITGTLYTVLLLSRLVGMHATGGK